MAGAAAAAAAGATPAPGQPPGLPPGLPRPVHPPGLPRPRQQMKPAQDGAAQPAAAGSSFPQPQASPTSPGSPQRQSTLPVEAEVVLHQELPAPVANPPAIVMEYVSGRSLG